MRPYWKNIGITLCHVGCFSNRWLLIGVTIMIGLQLLFTYWPWMNQTFRSAPLDQTEWWLIIGWGLIIYGLVGIEKTLRRWIAHKPKDVFHETLISD